MSWVFGSQNMLPLVSTFITGMANFSTQYNFQTIGLALIMMSQSTCTVDDTNCGQGIQASWVVGASEAAVFIGAVCGEIAFGYLGDYLSRSQAMMLTMTTALFGTFVSSFLSLGSPTSVYALIITFRFVMGIGLGGVYPLSATKAAEDAAHTSGKVNSQASSWSFFWQLPALLGPWFLGYCFTFDHSLSIEYRWRLVLGLGTLPSILTLIALGIEWSIINAKKSSSKALLGDIEVQSSVNNSLSSNLVYQHMHTQEILEASLPRLQSVNMGTGKNTNRNSSIAHVNPINNNNVVHQKKNHHKELSLSEIYYLLSTSRTIGLNLFATGSCWFLYDVVVYGLGLLSGYTISAIDGDDGNISSDHSVRELCKNQLIALVSTIPVTIISIKLVPILGLKNLQILGFASVAFCCLILACSFTSLQNSSPNSLFGLYCACYLSLNFGLGITTFSMPAALFPKKIRATFNGLAAALGKCGAVVSTFTFYLIAEDVGYPALLAICTVVAILGVLITFFFIDTKSLLNEESSAPNTDLKNSESSQRPSYLHSVDSSFTATTINPMNNNSDSDRPSSNYNIHDVAFQTDSVSVQTSATSVEAIKSVMHTSDEL